MKILSGIQPSGTLHIGNYFGMMRQMIRYQKEHTLFCFIVNYHALTSVTDGPRLAADTLSAAADFLALGLDPAKCFFWVQGDVPEVTELTWILSNVTPMGLLERAHSYKDKIAKGIAPNHGLFAYPVLMAADILLYQADRVPVGKDQKQHLEMTRDIAIRFNYLYGDTFVVPEAEIDDDLAVIPGIDGQKMSKSYGNTIDIFEDEAELKKKVMSVVTDSRGVQEVKDPDTDNLFALISLFMTADERAELKARYLAPGLKYSEVKKDLARRIWEYFTPYREKRAALVARPDDIRDILKKGAEKTRAEAVKTLDVVMKKVGLVY
ncbi:MAG: tryptophan--tRNA ligase [Deltaproteobacteria bacterium]|nr:tryptophan--tRNA ligase [Candidatus Zymogenaceae bacterium]